MNIARRWRWIPSVGQRFLVVLLVGALTGPASSMEFVSAGFNGPRPSSPAANIEIQRIQEQALVEYARFAGREVLLHSKTFFHGFHPAKDPLTPPAATRTSPLAQAMTEKTVQLPALQDAMAGGETLLLSDQQLQLPSLTLTNGFNTGHQDRAKQLATMIGLIWEKPKEQWIAGSLASLLYLAYASQDWQSAMVKNIFQNPSHAKGLRIVFGREGCLNGAQSAWYPPQYGSEPVTIVVDGRFWKGLERTREVLTKHLTFSEQFVKPGAFRDRQDLIDSFVSLLLAERLWVHKGSHQTLSRISRGRQQEEERVMEVEAVERTAAAEVFGGKSGIFQGEREWDVIEALLDQVRAVDAETYQAVAAPRRGRVFRPGEKVLADRIWHFVQDIYRHTEVPEGMAMRESLDGRTPGTPESSTVRLKPWQERLAFRGAAVFSAIVAVGFNQSNFWAAVFWLVISYGAALLAFNEISGRRQTPLHYLGDFGISTVIFLIFGSLTWLVPLKYLHPLFFGASLYYGSTAGAALVIALLAGHFFIFKPGRSHPPARIRVNVISPKRPGQATLPVEPAATMGRPGEGDVDRSLTTFEVDAAIKGLFEDYRSGGAAPPRARSDVSAAAPKPPQNDAPDTSLTPLEVTRTILRGYAEHKEKAVALFKNYAADEVQEQLGVVLKGILPQVNHEGKALSSLQFDNHGRLRLSSLDVENPFNLAMVFVYHAAYLHGQDLIERRSGKKFTTEMIQKISDLYALSAQLNFGINLLSDKSDQGDAESRHSAWMLEATCHYLEEGYQKLRNSPEFRQGSASSAFLGELLSDMQSVLEEGHRVLDSSVPYPHLPKSFGLGVMLLPSLGLWTGGFYGFVITLAMTIIGGFGYQTLSRSPQRKCRIAA